MEEEREGTGSWSRAGFAGAGQGNGARTPCSQTKLRAFSGILPLPLSMTETLSNEVWVNEKETIKNMQKRTEGKRTQKWKRGVEEEAVLVLTTPVPSPWGKS